MADSAIDLVSQAIEEHGKAVKEMRSDFEKELNSVRQDIRHALGASGSGLTALRNGKPEGFEEMDGTVTDPRKKHAPRDVGHMVKAFTESEQFGHLSDGAPSTGRVALEGYSVKSITNAGQGVEGSTGFNVQPQRADGIFNDPRRELTLLSVLRTLPVQTGTFEYVKLGNYVNNAAFQLEEGEEKQETTVPTDVVETKVATVAHWCSASVQVLSDEPALAQQIGNLLGYGLLARLESEIIAGPGGQGRIKGLLELASEYTGPGVGEAADIIGEALTEMSANGWKPGVIVLNPTDWFSIISERAANGDGQYVLGSPRDPAPPSLWGVPVVTTPSIGVDTALVIDPEQVALLDRQAPTLMMSREDKANFTSNLVTILAELRAGLAVFADGAVLKLDLNPTQEPEG